MTTWRGAAATDGDDNVDGDYGAVYEFNDYYGNNDTDNILATTYDLGDCYNSSLSQSDNDNDDDNDDHTASISRDWC